MCASNYEEDKDKMLSWVTDFDLVLENILEDMTNEHETSKLTASEKELEIKDSDFVGTQTQRYVSVYSIYEHAVRKSECAKCLA